MTAVTGYGLFPSRRSQRPVAVAHNRSDAWWNGFYLNAGGEPFVTWKKRCESEGWCLKRIRIEIIE